MEIKDKVFIALFVLLVLISLIQQHQLYVLRDKVLVHEDCIVQLQKHAISNEIKELDESVKGLESTLRKGGYVQ